MSQEREMTWEERKSQEGSRILQGIRGVSKQEGFAAHASSSPAAAFLEMGCTFALLPPQLLPPPSIIKFYRLYNMS